METKLARIAKAAEMRPNEKFTSLVQRGVIDFTIGINRYSLVLIGELT